MNLALIILAPLTVTKSILNCQMWVLEIEDLIILESDKERVELSDGFLCVCVPICTICN